MKILITLICISIFSQVSYSQIDSVNFIYKDIDTLKVYDVDLYYKRVNNTSSYFVNGEKVSKAIYDKYNGNSDNLGNCRPCYLLHYNEKGILVKFAAQYTDCRIGEYKEFFKDGKLKVNGNYLKNPTGNWDDLWKRGYCSVKHGKWEYYNIHGMISKIEYYSYGKLEKSEP